MLLSRLFAVSCLLVLAACQFRPLYGETSSTLSGDTANLAAVEVSNVSTRVGQQVRNHLVFLFTGGRPTPEKTHEAVIRVSSGRTELAAIPDPSIQDSTAGTVSVNVSYSLIDKETGKTIATGARIGQASYDRTGQVFANQRAVRDAENRAAREAAEAIRLAIASDINRVQ